MLVKHQPISVFSQTAARMKYVLDVRRCVKYIELLPVSEKYQVVLPAATQREGPTVSQLIVLIMLIDKEFNDWFMDTYAETCNI